MRFAVYENGYLKDIFAALEEAIDCAEYMCDTYSCHIQELGDNEDARELSEHYNWTGHYYYGEDV